MPVGIKVKGLDKIQKKLNKTSDNFKMADAFLYTLGNDAKSEIIKRTTMGRDYQHKKMTYNGKVYSKNYKKFRRETNRATNRRTLSYRGNMLRSIRPKKLRNGVRLWFPDTEEREKAIHQQIDFRTVFFKLSNNQRKRYKNKLRKYLTKDF